MCACRSRGCRRSTVRISWVAVLSAPWCLALVVGSAASWSHLPAWLAPAVVAGVAAEILATVAVGWWAGRRKLWRAVPPLGLIGTGALAAWYVAAQLATSPPFATGDTGDLAAGAGLALLAVPTLVVVLLLLYAGAGLGRLRAQLVRLTT